MYKISININKNGEGFFSLDRANKTVGKIKFALINGELILLDTIVLIKRYLVLIGRKLLHEIVEYARMHELKIITISKFVQKHFSNNPLLYADVWEKA